MFMDEIAIREAIRMRAVGSRKWKGWNSSWAF